jgi:hypothetical protein
MPYKYAYITGCLILSIFWLLMFLKRKDLRREMLWASFLGMPFGFIEIFFVPYYWKPESLFNLMGQYGFGMEGFLYSFLIAGIAAVGYEFLERKKTVKIKRNKRLHIAPFVLFLVVFLGFEVLFPAKPMLNLVVAFFCGVILTVMIRPDLLKQVLASGLIFGVFYFIIFAFVNITFGDLVSRFYSSQIMNNLKILGVPIEEIIFAFAGGAFWSTIYEYTKAYREVDV